MPDNEADYGDHEADPEDIEDIEDADELTTEALAWQLLLLVNPGDEETALRQFSHYREAMAEAGGDVEPVWLLKDAIDWTSGFFVDWKDAESFIDSVAELVRRWNLDIDWGGDPSDEEFHDNTDIPALMATAYDRLRERGYTLWTWDTGSDNFGGWITSSRDDEAMRLVALALNIELRPGSDSF
ncbi:hypothetical protein CSC74_08640 [Pseudoxanthomonas yeongjuensis]|uniref:DUF6630 family protein n=1 Tax=Pseudoxanthomonas yeongjuensis TaxID=377616 RepID=UPI001390BB7F|nr:hypothetical protein [Pseudoxanthomonas yeongjuensis]KAF1716925.1 hypothetical protein CSC74_08640 [Pseudoxanthomonas yeongjuensis]